MKKYSKFMKIALTLSLFSMLTGCTTSNVKDGNIGVKVEESENGREDEKTNDVEVKIEEPEDVEVKLEELEEKVEAIELKLGENAKISPKEIESLYKQDTDMLLRFNDFVGKKAPDFNMTSLEGKEIKFSDYEGENVIVEFMGTWCPACVSTTPINDKFNNSQEDVKIIGVGINDNIESLKKLIDENDVKNTEYFVGEDEVMDKYDLMFVPMYMFVDSEGYVQMLLAGDAPIEVLEEYTAKSFK